MSSPRNPVISHDQAKPAPFVLITGPEELLGERAVQRIVALARQDDPEVELSYLDASDPAGPLVQTAAGGSLFAESSVVVAQNVGQLSEAFLNDSLAYLTAPNDLATVIWRHQGGQRGKKLLDALRQAGASEVACLEIKYDSEKSRFAQGEFDAAQRPAEPAAIQALVEAVGADLRELASACQQLISDTDGPITKATVDRYYGGRVEATGFAVADSAIQGDAAKAIALARHAMSSGVDPLPLVAALAAKLRTLARVGGARRAGLNPTKDLKVAPWQVQKAQRELHRWNGATLGQAIRAVARADAEIKGLGGAPGKVARAYAAERAILKVAQLSRSGS
ncbi:MAG: DNA polymerase III subunit delta [Micrococcales bacterium]|nr:DNA polymerase III subunit delta [Micrococcales bacterium]